MLLSSLIVPTRVLDPDLNLMCPKNYWNIFSKFQTLLVSSLTDIFLLKFARNKIERWSLVNLGSLNVFGFFMLALPRRASFWPPSMVYISIIITHITNYIFFMMWLNDSALLRVLPGFILVQLFHRSTLWWYSNSN